MQHSTTKFHKFGNTMVTDASDLGRDIFSQIHSDGQTGVGIVIVSHKTDLAASFFLEDTVRDEDGDNQFWLLVPTPTTIRLYPQLKDFTVKIFND